jgi:6-pyruvoyltetrahydropterin/6-carboxytetrahydropterin synthase
VVKKTSLYTLKIEVDFSAAHKLYDYVGPCERLHGHNYTLEVEIRTQTLDRQGMVIDSATIKQYVKQIVARIDHYYLNELEPFTTVSPTAENIAQWLYQQLETALNAVNVPLHAITLWETDRFCVRYEEV